MADIATSIEMRDPLAGSGAVTGPQYMDALSKLGYNVENMTSQLPIATRNFNLASSLITHTYQQQMDWQKAQAELQYNVAQAKHLDSETEYNQKSMQTRLRDLDVIEKMRENDLITQNSTMDGAIRAANAKNDEAVQNDLISKANWDEIERQQNENKQALQDKDSALLSLDGLQNSTDYPNDYLRAFNAHTQFATNSKTKALWDAKVKAIEDARTTSANVLRAGENYNNIIEHLKAHNLPEGLWPEARRIANNPSEYQMYNIQGNLTATQSQIARILSMFRGVPTNELSQQAQQQIKDLLATQADLKAIMGTDDGHIQIAKGIHSDWITPDGKLNAGAAGELNELEAINAARLKKGEEKSPTTTVEVPIPLTDDEKMNGSPQRYAKISGIPLDQADEMRRTLAAEMSSDVRAGKELLARAARGEREFDEPTGVTAAAAAAAGKPTATASPEMTARLQVLMRPGTPLRAAYNEAQRTGNWTEFTRLANAALKGPTRPSPGGVGYQTGGTVFNPASVGAGSTDTVPAMLTPGEYVVSKPAVDAVGKETLDQINQGGGIATSIKLENPLASIASQMGGSGQRQQQPSDTKTASAQPETKPWWQGGTPWYGKQPSTDSTSPEIATAPAAAAVGAAAANPNLARSPSQVEPSSPIGGSWKSVVGSEFGEVDNPVYGGYTEPGWDKGAWGDKLSGWDTQGVALPGVPHGTLVEVRNPQTGATTQAKVIDSGPNPKTGAGIDMTGGTRAALGYARNFKGPVQYRIISAMQHGGMVQEEGSIGTGPGRGGGRGGIEQQLDQPSQPSQRRRRFHPRLGAAGGLGAIGSDIPDPMQKKLAKLSQDFMGGLGDLIRQRPEIGPALLKHARNQLAANLGSQEGEGEQQQESVPGQQQMRVPPEAYGGGMTAYGGSEGTAYMQAGGSVMPEDTFNKMMLDPEAAGINFQGGGSVDVPPIPGGAIRPHYERSPLGGIERQALPPQAPRGPSSAPSGGFKTPQHPDWEIYTTDPQQGHWLPGIMPPVMPGGPAPWDDVSLAQLTHSHNLLTQMMAQKSAAS